MRNNPYGMQKLNKKAPQLSSTMETMKAEQAQNCCDCIISRQISCPDKYVVIGQNTKHRWDHTFSSAWKCWKKKHRGSRTSILSLRNYCKRKWMNEWKSESRKGKEKMKRRGWRKKRRGSSEWSHSISGINCCPVVARHSNLACKSVNSAERGQRRQNARKETRLWWWMAKALAFFSQRVLQLRRLSWCWEIWESVHVFVHSACGTRKM